jgi:hypothetical protein
VKRERDIMVRRRDYRRVARYIIGECDADPLCIVDVLMDVYFQSRFRLPLDVAVEYILDELKPQVEEEEYERVKEYIHKALGEEL